MSYLTRDAALRALKRMKDFHDDVIVLYQKHDMDILDDLGRRNILLSPAQEQYFAEELAKQFPGTHSDGHPGQPDILIPVLDKELECKLTSRHKSGAWSFQTDFETLTAKGSLDYLYVLASSDFEDFAVLHFEGLTIDDFRPLANGARGKVAMFKHKAMAKCNVLVGEVRNNNEIQLQNINEKLSQTPKSMGPSTEYLKLMKRYEYWSTTPTKYSFELETVC